MQQQVARIIEHNHKQHENYIYSMFRSTNQALRIRQFGVLGQNDLSWLKKRASSMFRIWPRRMSIELVDTVRGRCCCWCVDGRIVGGVGSRSTWQRSCNIDAYGIWGGWFWVEKVYCATKNGARPNDRVSVLAMRRKDGLYMSCA